MAAIVTTSRKPYKLKATGEGEPLTRDDMATWQHILLGHMRQDEKWHQFLPPTGLHKTWTSSEDSDETYGLTAPGSVNHTALVATAKLQFDCKRFVTCMATWAPTNFSETIIREATSFDWVMKEIKESYGLNTKGEHFMALDDIKFEFSANFTHN